uniref:Uncharacterized protein n=1 Tax=viral metagenome TaxID=1070528 RepID=A0A6H2A6N2_9ZZZZ
MQCPLPYQKLFNDEGIAYASSLPCLQAECAWWDTTFEWCTEQTKAHQLHVIACELAEIRLKMPHVEKFKR